MEKVRLQQLEEQRIEERTRQLERDVKRKTEELANTTLLLAKKNETLLQLREELAKLYKRDHSGQPPRNLLHVIDRDLNSEAHWEIFEAHFNEVHADFLQQLRRCILTYWPAT
jgi:hypothetical protein